MPASKSKLSADTERARILLIDDDLDLGRGLQKSLERRLQLKCFHAATARQALELWQRERPELVVADLCLDERIGPQSGLDLISELLEQDPSLPLIVLTANGSEEYGLESLRRGASSFLVKPVAIETLQVIISDKLTSKRLVERLLQPAQTKISSLTSRSAVMRKTLEQAYFAAANRQAVLLVGETGVGKGYLARLIHEQSSARPAGSKAPFIRFQASFGSPDLVASELFGHEKGAFTGAQESRRGLLEEAHQGTLFLDEVDELPQETQIQLLNVLQEKVFRRLGSNRELRSDFRLISATNRPIDEALKLNKLRKDFYHRLSHLSILIPPLRERPEDLLDLAQGFIQRFCKQEGEKELYLSEAATELLLTYHWPGNVRELEAQVEGACLRARYQRRRIINREDFSLEHFSKSQSLIGRKFREQVQRYEEELVEKALHESGGNQAEAARLLEMDRKVLCRILKRRKAD